LLDLVPEPNNPHSEDGNAVAVKYHGHQLGYVPARHDWVARALLEGTDLRCVVARVEKGGWFFPKARSVVLRIDVLDAAERAARMPAHDAAADAVRRNREQRARDACLDGLRILHYVALSDDALTDEKIKIEAAYIDARLAMMDFSHDSELIEALIVTARGLVVPKRSFARVVKTVTADKAHFHLVWDAVQRFAATTKLNMIEVEAVEQLATTGRKSGWIE
jgi:hypothetical protein